MKKNNSYGLYAAALTIFLFFGLILFTGCSMPQDHSMDGMSDMQHETMPMEKPMDDMQTSKDTMMGSDKKMTQENSMMQ